MKRNDNNAGRVDVVSKPDASGKKAIFFIEKSENHDRP